MIVCFDMCTLSSLAEIYIFPSEFEIPVILYLRTMRTFTIFFF